MKKLLLRFLIGGSVYYAIEGFWHLMSNNGWANISMFLVGGICFTILGKINDIPAFYKSSIKMQSLIGAIIILIVEFISGVILNIILKLGIWSYDGMVGNILGQVCVLYGILWFFLVPFAIWLEDRIFLIRYAYMLYRGIKLNDEVLYDYTLLQLYKELLTIHCK